MIESKITPAAPRPGVVPRPVLVNRLRRDPAAVVSLVARAGYGKTTLLAQWAAAESRAVAWVTIDARDNDAVVLLKHVVAAVDRIEPLDRRLLASLAPGRTPASVPVVDRAARAVAACRTPFLLVLDNAHLLHTAAARRSLSTLIAAAPEGSTVALASRTAPKLATAALRRRGSVREIGADELAFSHREARLLLRTANPELTEEETAELIAVCEGWPAALYLASLSPRDRALPPSRFAGSDRYVAEYMQSELLSPLHPRDLRFLRRASILEELTAPLCDAVLHSGDSAAELKALARTNLVVVPVEEKRGCYRLPLLFRDLLLRELTEDEPQLVPTLHRRAASWYEHAGDPDSALDHANAAGDADRVASIVTAIALSASCAGRVASVERSLARFEEAQLLAEYPAVALVGAWINALGGRAADAERCLEVAERGSRRRGREAAALRPRTAVVRAALCRTGPREMLTDARAALRALARTSEWYPVALHMHGTAAMLLGSTDEARSSLAAAVEAAAAHDYSETRMIARAQLSLLARDEDDAEAAGMLTAEPREIAGTELAGRPSSAIALAAVAQTSLQQGRWADARELVTAAEPLRPLLTEALPWLAVETRLALGRCYVRLRDADGARRVVAEIDAILDARPRLGVLVEHARTLRHETAALAQEQGATAGLTPAELRLLPLLATHLSFREIADQLQVSHNTVKTQAISIYRKLGVSGRSDAIAAAAELRLRAA